jgi:chemotaxis protein histidine kinase CheA
MEGYVVDAKRGRTGFPGVLVLGALVLLGTVGCEGYEAYSDPSYIPSENDLTRVAVEWPDDDPMKPTAQALALERYATAVAFESIADQAEATRAAAESQAEQRYVVLTAEAQATADAHARAIEQQRVWATQQAANATQVAQATAQAIAIAETAQAQALAATAMQRSWEATATTEAWNRQATATAQYKADVATATAEAVSFAQTATRAAWEERSTATAEIHTATAQAYHTTMTRQAERREETLGYARDYGLPVLLLIFAGLLGGLCVYGFKQWQKRPIVYSRSVLGDAEPMAVRRPDGGYTLIDLDRQPGHVTQLLGTGEVQVPQFRAAAQEERTTARDQAVDAVTRPRLGAGQSRTEAPVLPEPPGAAPVPGLRSVRTLRRIDQAGVAGFLPPALIESIEHDWQED